MESSLANWWDYDGSETAKRALATIATINQAQVGLHHDNLRYMRMYENREYFTTAISNYMIKAYSQVRRYSYNLRNSQMNMNVVAPVVDTLVSKIGKERVRPQYLTSGDIVEVRNSCEDLNDWIYGMFHETGLYEWNKRVFRGACIFGKSGVKTFIGKDKHGKLVVKAEPVFMPEIIVDPYDSYYNDPQCLYQQKFMTRDYLLSCEEYRTKQAENAIRNATLVSNTLESSAHNTIVVWEAWRRSNEKNKGKHIIFTDAGLIYEEEWDECNFWIDFFEYKQSPIGFYGIGVCEELMPVQVELNRIVNHIRDSLILCSNPRTYVQGTPNQFKNMSNRIGGIYPYPAGSQPPITVAPPVVSPDTWKQLDVLWNRAFEIAGISQMSAAGRNTLGASASGEAIRNYVDVESDRFAELQQNWEDFHVRIAKRFHSVARKIVAIQGEYRIDCYDQDRGLWTLDFADIDIPNNSYTIQCFPSSSLPKLPGPRLATVKEWRDEGYIDGDQARELQNIPDLKRTMQYLTAPTKMVEYALETMAYQKTPKQGEDWIKYVPEPYMDLELAKRLGVQMYNYMLYKLPQDTKEKMKEKLARLDLIREWIDAAVEMTTSAAPTEGGSMEGTPSALPMPSTETIPGAQRGMPQQALAVPGMQMS